jgi:hypothetical protein
MPPPSPTRAMPPAVVDSNVFRSGDRAPMTYESDYTAHYVAHAVDGTGRLSAADRAAQKAASNRSNLPFLDGHVPLVSDTQAFYVHHGAAYRPENMQRAAQTDSGHTDIVFGHAAATLTSVTRDSYQRGPIPQGKSREARQEEIQATRSGRAVVRSLAGHAPTMVSTLEAGNRAMLAAPSLAAAPAAGGAPGGAPASEVVKIVSVRLGYNADPVSTDYRDAFKDARHGVADAANPYRTENRVHEVDPSAMGGAPAAATAPNGQALLTVTGPDGTLHTVTRVRSAIDFGHEASDGRSVYMTSTGAPRVWLTATGGWHTHVAPFVPIVRPRFAANANHPAVAAMAAARAQADARGM